MRVIVLREFNWRRPASKFSFNIKPTTAPQSVVHDVGEAAVAAGAAVRVASTRPPHHSGFHPKETTT